MKNKKLSWILLPVVLGIWGAIGWQVYAAMKGDDGFVMNGADTVTITQSTSVIPDTFKLLLDYSDPFLDKSKTNIKTVPINNNAATTTKKTEPGVASMQWPAISYSGLVRQPNSDRMVGFLSLNGRTHFVKTGDVIDLIRVGIINKDSVEIVMGKERRFFRK